MAGLNSSEPIIIGQLKKGSDTILEWGVIIGHPSKKILLKERNISAGGKVEMGDRCIIRSGSVIYEDVVLGSDVQTAHHVVVREGAHVGDGCVLGNGAVVREHARLGKNVRAMECVVISEGAEIGQDVFIGPNVSFTGGRFMTGAMEASGQMTHDEAAAKEGKYWEGPSVVVEDGVRIGANAVILAGVRLGEGCVIAAGSVVSVDVPARTLVAGNPARILRKDL